MIPFFSITALLADSSLSYDAMSPKSAWGQNQGVLVLVLHCLIGFLLLPESRSMAVSEGRWQWINPDGVVRVDGNESTLMVSTCVGRQNLARDARASLTIGGTDPPVRPLSEVLLIVFFCSSSSLPVLCFSSSSSPTLFSWSACLSVLLCTRLLCMSCLFSKGVSGQPIFYKCGVSAVLAIIH